MAADVLCGGRSYVQTRFLATEDSSTLTPPCATLRIKNIPCPKNILVDKVKKERTVPAYTGSHERHWWHHEVRLDRHWSHVIGGCIRSAPELSRRPPACHCGSRRCDEGRCRRCRPFDSCAPRMVGGAQQSTLRPLDRAAANLAAAGTMESCAMILRGVHPWGLARPSKLSVPGELLAAVRKGGRPMRPTLACDQWLCWQHRGHHRRCRAQRACSCTVRSFTTLPR